MSTDGDVQASEKRDTVTHDHDGHVVGGRHVDLPILESGPDVPGRARRKRTSVTRPSARVRGWSREKTHFDLTS